jgi:hypothetical protein
LFGIPFWSENSTNSYLQGINCIWIFYMNNNLQIKGENESLKTLFSILNINISKINHGKLLPLWMASTLSSERKGSVLLQFFLIPGYPNGSAARIIFYIKIGSSKLCFGSAVSCTKDWYIFHSICMAKFSKKKTFNGFTRHVVQF